MTRRTGKSGPYWAVDYDVVMYLGTVEIKAYVEWEEYVSRDSSMIKGII